MSSKNDPIKEDQEEEDKIPKENKLSQSRLENIDSCQQEDERKNPEDETDYKEEEESKILCLGESEVAEDDDGFKTPTSLDHRIPAMTQCPPAPKKMLPEPSLKRKVSPPRFDVSDAEVESIFSPISEDLKLKKPRRDDDEDEDD
ncbi:Hypothetical predicted protein [Olea europaea subsp. europaea]|uniref:Uncharacterized protein n=1 Tax=Olea europaea subsp. europaea TaxID=158383 RepID=A0A8S0VD75_OLEEU|nr:Hypothetical predicted protein [Olea europaea subsp. europaea]